MKKKHYPIMEYIPKKNRLERVKGKTISIDEKCLYIPVFCHLCGKKLEYSEDFFKISDGDWKKYIPPPLKLWVVCKPCYGYIKKLFPDGWRKTKLPIYITVPAFPVGDNDLDKDATKFHRIKVLRLTNDYEKYETRHKNE